MQQQYYQQQPFSGMPQQQQMFTPQQQQQAFFLQQQQLLQQQQYFQAAAAAAAPQQQQVQVMFGPNGQQYFVPQQQQQMGFNGVNPQVQQQFQVAQQQQFGGGGNGILATPQQQLGMPQQQQQFYCQMPNGTLQLVSMPTGAATSTTQQQQLPQQQSQQFFVSAPAPPPPPPGSATGGAAQQQQQQPFFVVMPGSTNGANSLIGGHQPLPTTQTSSTSGGGFGGNSSTSSGNGITNHASPNASNTVGAQATTIAWQQSPGGQFGAILTAPGAGGNVFVVPGAANGGGIVRSPQSSLSTYPQMLVGAASPPHGNQLMMAFNASAHSLPGAGNTLGSISQTANSSMSTRPPTDVYVWGYAVVDQYHPSLQRLPVPPSVVSKTRGTVTYNNDVQASSTKPCASTVCLKFTTRNAPPAESCPLEDQCPSFHIERSYLEAARAVAEPLCCGLHNDYFSQEMLTSGCAPHLAQQRFILVLEDRAEIELSPLQLCLTVGLDQLTHRGPAPSAGSLTSTRVINMRKQICRLHYEGKCKWTKDCGHVHLCRELHRYLLSFHFPSLMFLLTTEPNRERIESKLKDEKQLGDFVRSRCVMPLITQMIEGGRTTALEALFASGAVATTVQYEAAEALGVQLPPESQRNIVEVHPKIVRIVNPRSTIQELKQRQAASSLSAAASSSTATALAKIPVPSTAHLSSTGNSVSEDPRMSGASSHGQHPLSLESHENIPAHSQTSHEDDGDGAALIAMQVAEAGITSPTRMEGRSLTMPSFSPNASATSDARAVHSPQ